MPDNNNSEKLILTLEGENQIDITLLVKTLTNLSNSFTRTIKTIQSDAEISLQVEALNKGSFEIVIGSLITNVASLLPTIKTALPSIKTFIEIIKLKNELQGKKPQSVSQDEETSKIVTQTGEVHYHNCSVTQLYLNNPHIDKSISDIFTPFASESNRDAIKISSDTESIIIPQNQYKNMAKNIVEDTKLDQVKHEEYEVNAQLLLKKPDLLGESMWQFQYQGKIIDATIDDKKFLAKVKDGKIKQLYAQVKVPVQMKIEVTIDKVLDQIHKKYTVLKVTGDIIEPNEQLPL